MKCVNKPLPPSGTVVRGEAISAGIPEDRMPLVTIADESTPATYSNPELAQRISGVFKELLRCK